MGGDDTGAVERYDGFDLSHDFARLERHGAGLRANGGIVVAPDLWAVEHWHDVVRGDELAVDLAVSLSLGGLQDRAPKRDGEVCCHEALAGVQIVLPGFVDNPEEAPALCSCIRQCEVNF